MDQTTILFSIFFVVAVVIGIVLILRNRDEDEPECVSNNQCAQGETCSQGKCSKECSAEKPCDEGKECRAGVCTNITTEYTKARNSLNFKEGVQGKLPDKCTLNDLPFLINGRLTSTLSGCKNQLKDLITQEITGNDNIERNIFFYRIHTAKGDDDTSGECIFQEYNRNNDPDCKFIIKNTEGNQDKTYLLDKNPFDENSTSDCQIGYKADGNFAKARCYPQGAIC